MFDIVIGLFCISVISLFLYTYNRFIILAPINSILKKKISMKSLQVLQVKKLVPTALLPAKGSSRAAGYDLHSIDETIVPAKGKKLVKTGLSIACPPGNYARIGKISSFEEHVY